jgi:hypothetical protein
MPRWHQLDPTNPKNFCHRLNEELRERGLDSPVWRSWKSEPVNFGWSGANQHNDRIEAGSKLYELWLDLLTHDPSARIHVVAHSHGANVTLRTISQYLRHLKTEAVEIANLAQSFLSSHSPDKALELTLQSYFKVNASRVCEDRQDVLNVLKEELKHAVDDRNKKLQQSVLMGVFERFPRASLLLFQRQRHLMRLQNNSQ